MSSKLTLEQCRQFVEEHLFSPASGLTSGMATDTIGAIGMELETFPFIKSAKHRFGVAPVKLYDPSLPLVELLVHAAAPYGGRGVSKGSDKTISSSSSAVDKIVFDNGDLIQFEPGGQIEISTAPCHSLSDLHAHLYARKELLNDLTKQHHIHFAQVGTNPWFTVQEIGNQLDRPRYRVLEQYFDGISPYGKQMMLQTGSLHINLDLGDNLSTRVKRIVAANLIVPFVTALFAHSPIVGGIVTGHKAHRSFIWQHLDESRTGILPLDDVSASLSLEALASAYLEMALKAPVMYIRTLDNRMFPREVTMAHWMEHGVEGVWPSMSDFENHVSLLFPEVRLKGYLEIRSVDAPPPGWEMAPVMFYTGLLYTDAYLDKTLELLLPYASRMNELFAGAVYGLERDELYLLAKQLIHLALDGFVRLPVTFKEGANQHLLVRFYEEFTSRRRTFADEQLETFISAHSFLS